MQEKLVRQLGAWGIWLLAVNGMVGAGIFGVPAGAARLVGVWSPIAFAACALLIGAVIWCFAELASLFRNTGGPIVYVRDAFGPLAGFETGWAFWVARVTAFAANLNLLVVSLGYFWPDAANGMTRVALIALIVTLLGWVNVVGVKHAMRSIGVLTLLKFLPLVALVVFGASHVHTAALPSPASAPGAAEFGAAVLLVIYAFVGWEAAVVPGGETREPRRDMPRGLFWGLAVVAALYVTIQAVAYAVHPDLAASERALLEVGDILLGPAGAALVAAGVVVSVGGNSASSMLTAPRLTYALARDGMLPRWFGVVHERWRTPANSVVFYGVVAFALATYGSFVWLAAMSALVRVLIYMACIATMPALRRRYADTPGAMRVPGGWWVPAGAFAVCALLLTQVGALSVLVTAGFLVAGAAIYAMGRRA